MSNRALLYSLCLLLVQAVTQVLAGTQFASHVSVNTPARSFTHGVGDPLPYIGSRRHQLQARSFRRPPVPSHRVSNGYPRLRPTIPFNHEDLPRSTPPSVRPWLQDQNDQRGLAVAIPLLPPSPYKVDSPDPESLWPEGLFLPPLNPPRFDTYGLRSDDEADPFDPYLLEGSEAVAAVARAENHGPLYFHDIPHIESLLSNQALRVKNHLEPHNLGSIRHTWPFFRP